MSRAWNEIDWEMDRPSLDDLIESWRGLRWEPRDLSVPALDIYLAALASSRPNGGYLIGRWKAVEYSDVTHWFASRNRFSEYELFRTLFESVAFRERLPELRVPGGLARVPGGLKEQWAGSLRLDGEWAGLLAEGGAYREFKGTPREAKVLASTAADALIGERFDEFRVDITHEAWTPWFADIAWDSTFVITDKRNAEVIVLCTTDSD